MFREEPGDSPLQSGLDVQQTVLGQLGQLLRINKFRSQQAGDLCW